MIAEKKVNGITALTVIGKFGKIHKIRFWKIQN